MKVLTIKQPWASAIIYGGKDIENRNWKTNHRGRILIHAAKTVDHEAMQKFIGEEWFTCRTMQLGGIIGSVVITGVVEKSDSKWFDGPYGFTLQDAKPLDFLPTKGMLNLWNFKYPPDEMEKTIIDTNWKTYCRTAVKLNKKEMIDRMINPPVVELPSGAYHTPRG